MRGVKGKIYCPPARVCFFFQAEDGIRDIGVTGVQTCALPIWNAAEVRRLFPSNESTVLFLDWMQRHQLGRKRILDTQLAAIFWTAGVRQVLTANPADFQLFGFQLLTA